jgi:hypothetical protein
VCGVKIYNQTLFENKLKIPLCKITVNPNNAFAIDILPVPSPPSFFVTLDNK